MRGYTKTTLVSFTIPCGLIIKMSRSKDEPNEIFLSCGGKIWLAFRDNGKWIVRRKDLLGRIFEENVFNEIESHLNKFPPPKVGSREYHEG